VKDGLLVARTIVPDKVDDVPVRVLNTTSAPVVVSKGTLLSNLQPLVPMEEATTAPSADRRKADLEIITDMLARIDDSVPLHLCDKLRALLHNYSDVFSKDEWDLGWTKVVTHRIDTGNHEPVRQPFRRYPPAHLQAIDKHVADMQQQGIIEPACGPWASNIVLAKKKDGTFRCCVDYRQLNDATRKDAYPLLWTDDCLDAMSGSHWFSTFDLRSSYHQVALDLRRG